MGEKIFGLSRVGKTDREVAISTADCFIRFMNEVGAPHTLTAARIPIEEIPAIAEDILAHGCDANGNLPSVPPIGKDGILEILNMAK